MTDRSAYTVNGPGSFTNDYDRVMNVISLPDADALARFAAIYVAEAIATEGHTNMALSGGSTPRLMHSYLRNIDVAWDNLDLWLGDERWVPSDDPESNAQMARETLVDAVAGRLLEVPFGSDPEAAAASYAATLERSFDAPHLVLLGIGDDSHTASLFPGSPALTMAGTYVSHFVPSKDVYRLTATFDYLARARKIVFLVSGAGKADALQGLLEGTDPPLPARIVADNAQDVTWLVDDAAAAGLASTEVTRP